MWDHKAWIVCERIIGLLTLLVLAYSVWYTLLDVKVKQAEQSQKLDLTLELFKQQMGDDEAWQNAVESLKNNSTK